MLICHAKLALFFKIKSMQNSQVENPPDPPESYCGRESPYDNVIPTAPRRSFPRKRPSTLPLFIGDHTNIDDILGEPLILAHSPVMSQVLRKEKSSQGKIQEKNTL